MGQKAKDLTDMKFGELTAIKIVDSTPNGKVWECKCSCGNVVNVISTRLLSGKTKSCGHIKREHKRIKEIVGKKFGRLEVLSEGEKPNHCICKCECGNIGEYYVSNVVSGKTQSCGCLQKDRVREALEEDLTGQRFGRWLVIGKSDESSKCICLCDCGKVKTVAKQSLKNGDSISCGCYKREFTSALMINDLSGKRFGKLVVVDREGSYTNKSGAKNVTWNCLCDCGNRKVVKSCDLIAGKVSSCGCMISRGEYIMRQELNNRHVLFDTQYSFPDFISDKNRPLRFDFAILDADKNLLCLIEYQGIQHDKQYEKYHVSFGEQQRNITDKMKQEYCKSRNILLFEIWYNQNIGVELDKILQSINYKPILCQASIEEG